MGISLDSFSAISCLILTPACSGSGILSVWNASWNTTWTLAFKTGHRTMRLGEASQAVWPSNSPWVFNSHGRSYFMLSAAALVLSFSCELFLKEPLPPSEFVFPTAKLID